MSAYIKLLPSYLIKRYKGWKATEFQKNKTWFNKISSEGQKPKTMVISCCDSRIHVTSIFGAEKGEFFIHRNIANLVPPYNPNGDHHGTSAAVEYAVKILKVSNIIVMGHSNCGGINHGYLLCKSLTYSKKTIFINKWLNIINPAYEKVLAKYHKISDEEGIKKLEKQSILVSIENLINFPFVKKALDTNYLVLHGLWHNIGTGEIESLDPKKENFIKI